MVDRKTLQGELEEALVSEGVIDLERWSALHSSYVDRYQSDSDRTWSTATWLVGVSWALFPAAVALEARLTMKSAAAFALASCALVLLWLAIASTYRAWASRSYDIVRALEQMVLDTHDEEIRRIVRSKHPVLPFLGPRPMTLVRILMVVGTVLAWGAFLIMVETGELTPPAAP